MVALIERYQPTLHILQQLRKLWRIDQILVLDLLLREIRGALDWRLYNLKSEGKFRPAEERSVNKGLLLRILLGCLALYTVGVRFPRTMQKNRRTIHAPLVLCVAHLFHRSACARGVPRSTSAAVSDRRPGHPSARCPYRNLG